VAARSESQRARNARKLLDQARRDIDGGGDPDYANRESESDDEIED
jgi:hypothetical protein